MSTEAIDPQRFRHVLGHFPTGVVVATALQEGGTPAGMAVGSFTSVSLDPPLVAFLPDKKSTSFPKIRQAGSFCINVLSGDQEQVCRAFAARGGDKFGDVSWYSAGSGSPIIDGAVAWIDCEIQEVLEAGDHYIVLGRVLDLAVGKNASPLLFFRGGYGQFTAPSLSAPARPDLLTHLRMMDCARSEMEHVAQECRCECLAVTVVADEIVTIGSAGQSYGQAPADRIGQRMPFVPPLCSLFVAWAGDEGREQWLRRLGPDVPAEDVAAYTDMVERVRARGWSMALGGRSHIAFELALARLSMPAPTAEQQRAVREAARKVGPHSHEPAELEDEQPYKVRNISAPVFDESGGVVLMLTLIGLPRVSRLEELAYFRDRLCAAADRVTRRLGGRTPVAVEDPLRGRSAASTG